MQEVSKKLPHSRSGEGSIIRHACNILVPNLPGSPVAMSAFFRPHLAQLVCPPVRPSVVRNSLNRNRKPGSARVRRRVGLNPFLPLRLNEGGGDRMRRITFQFQLILAAHMRAGGKREQKRRGDGEREVKERLCATFGTSTFAPN